ncbi:MAG: GPW/gp25 family protein [Syntrophomonadaceae bacterium]|nr:GPW/gp25 family protein [Syntrophomonadaceae bacterium]
MDNGAKAFLGEGWSFPVSVDEATGRIRTSEYEEDIKEAIHLIIMTRPGERMMRPNFGCGIQGFVFEGTDYTSRKQMENKVYDALIKWEPRIENVTVNIEADDSRTGAMSVEVSYVVRATNNPFNLVYPYFINEGV